jgi:predicted  nucleic acid-binding Zn-ribbon protein
METTETETETISNLKKKIIANHTDINNVMQMVDEIEDLARSDQAGKEQAEYPQIEKNTLQTVIDSLEEDLSNLEEEYHTRIEREDGSLTLPNRYTYEIDCYKKIIKDLKKFDIVSYEQGKIGEVEYG